MWSPQDFWNSCSLSWILLDTVLQGWATTESGTLGTSELFVIKLPAHHSSHAIISIRDGPIYVKPDLSTLPVHLKLFYIAWSNMKNLESEDSTEIIAVLVGERLNDVSANWKVGRTSWIYTDGTSRFADTKHLNLELDSDFEDYSWQLCRPWLRNRSTQDGLALLYDLAFSVLFLCSTCYHVGL